MTHLLNKYEGCTKITGTPEEAVSCQPKRSITNQKKNKKEKELGRKAGEKATSGNRFQRGSLRGLPLPNRKIKNFLKSRKNQYGILKD